MLRLLARDSTSDRLRELARSIRAKPHYFQEGKSDRRQESFVFIPANRRAACPATGLSTTSFSRSSDVHALSVCVRYDHAALAGWAGKIGACSWDCHHCGQLTPVVLSRRYGIDEGYNQTHKLGGFAEIFRVTVSGRYRSDGLDGPL